MSKAKLPGLMPVATGNAALDRLLQSIIERLEVREGSRGDRLEAVVTQRDLQAMGLAGTSWSLQGGSGQSVVVQTGANTFAKVSIDEFADKIKNSRLYKDLLMGLNDTARFDHYPKQVRDLLVTSIAEEAKKRGADIKRSETKLQTAAESLAFTVEEVTASIFDNAAGVRTVNMAFANAVSAQSAVVTQLKSSIGDYYGATGEATLEQTLETSASKVDGLRAQYMVKVEAGGAVSGFGLIAADNHVTQESAFLIQADKFALVSPGYSGGLSTVPDPNSIPFGVDARTGAVYINGSLTINGSGNTVNELLPATYKDYMFARGVGATVPAVSSPTDGNPGVAWTDAPQPGSGYLYMISADRMVSGEALKGSWTAPVRIDGYAGATVQYQYAIGSMDRVTGTWGTDVSTLPLGYFLWMQTGTPIPPSTTVAPDKWSTPVRISGEKGDKGEDGLASTVPGVPGATGKRGTIVTMISEIWSDAKAKDKISSVAQSSGAPSDQWGPIKGDIVSHPGGAKEYNGDAWKDVAAYINGSMIVTQTIGANKMSAGSFESRGDTAGTTISFLGSQPAVALLANSSKSAPVGGMFYGRATDGSLGVGGVSMGTSSNCVGVYGKGAYGGLFEGSTVAVKAMMSPVA